MFETCKETVSPLWALIFGAGDACIEMSMWSILLLILPFAAFVMVLQFVANRLLFGRRERPDAPRENRRRVRPKAGQRVARHLREADGDQSHSAAS
ncbi:hypothetical protein P1J78_10340 [Psychromarinibacter sp. C21-152]|uniref:Uncharacterized protein n=1 Tax=Psychromarinibacter sediminicola TaxID=3033385 RepID=A0AAE3NRH0_9RHOB|nr:hypothetical protein [Psychromarinibacter sediminicola]MDF0601129.1 hypothetical protein [Psychromarinibacter sediminicola]